MIWATPTLTSTPTCIRIISFRTRPPRRHQMDPTDKFLSLFHIYSFHQSISWEFVMHTPREAREPNHCSFLISFFRGPKKREAKAHFVTVHFLVGPAPVTDFFFKKSTHLWFFNNFIHNPSFFAATQILDSILFWWVFNPVRFLSSS